MIRWPRGRGHNSHEEQTFQNPLKPGRPEIWPIHVSLSKCCIGPIWKFWNVFSIATYFTSSRCFVTSVDKFWLRVKIVWGSLRGIVSLPAIFTKNCFANCWNPLKVSRERSVSILFNETRNPINYYNCTFSQLCLFLISFIAFEHYLAILTPPATGPAQDYWLLSSSSTEK